LERRMTRGRKVRKFQNVEPFLLPLLLVLPWNMKKKTSKHHFHLSQRNGRYHPK
jgi:hypothetical protein